MPLHHSCLLCLLVWDVDWSAAISREGPQRNYEPDSEVSNLEMEEQSSAVTYCSDWKCLSWYPVKWFWAACRLSHPAGRVWECLSSWVPRPSLCSGLCSRGTLPTDWVSIISSTLYSSSLSSYMCHWLIIWDVSLQGLVLTVQRRSSGMVSSPP